MISASSIIMSERRSSSTTTAATDVDELAVEDEEGTATMDIRASLNKIFDEPHLQCYLDSEQKKRWRCLWCNKNYTGWHATKALIHLAKVPKMDIAPCRAVLPDEEAQQYRSLFDQYMQKRASSQAQKTSISQSIDTRNDITAGLLAEQIAKKKRKSTSLIPLEVITITQSTTPTTATTVNKEYIQLKITGEANPNAEN
jgi:hypothetical protein